MIETRVVPTGIKLFIVAILIMKAQGILFGKRKIVELRDVAGFI